MSIERDSKPTLWEEYKNYEIKKNQKLKFWVFKIKHLRDIIIVDKTILNVLTFILERRRRSTPVLDWLAGCNSDSSILNSVMCTSRTA